MIWLGHGSWYDDIATSHPHLHQQVITPGWIIQWVLWAQPQGPMPTRGPCEQSKKEKKRFYISNVEENVTRLWETSPNRIENEQ